MTSGRRAGLFASLLLAVATACNGATWQSQHKVPGYEPPRRTSLYVVTSDQVNEQDTYGVVLTLVDTIEHDLAERGVETQVVAANGDPPPVPRVELRVTNSDSGDVAARAIAGMGAGAAQLSVECRVYPDDSGEPTFVGRVTGIMAGGTFDTGDPRDAARYAGEAIAKEVASAE